MKLRDVIMENMVVVPGVGQMTTEQLQQQIQYKLQDLLARAQRGDYASIGKSQLDILTLYWETMRQSTGMPSVG